MPAADSSRWWVASEAVVALAILALPWCFGGAPVWSTHVLCALSLLGLALWSTGASRNHRRWAAHPVLILPVATLALAAAQLAPLPPAMLAILGPPQAELRDFSLVPLGFSQWAPLTLDAPSTWRLVARDVGLLSLLFTALQLGRLPGVRKRLAAVVALNGLAIATCGFGHALASEDTLFGVHRFVAPLALMTPFGNINHLAAFLALASGVALALAVDSTSRDVSIGWLSVACACGVGVFLTFSRGGIGSFAATTCVLGAALLARRGGGVRSVLPWVAIGSTVAFAGLLSFEQLVERAETVSTVQKLAATKIELWPMLLRGSLHFWPAGLGLGAFELGFGRFQTEQLDVTFTHPENFALQWLAEVGAPMTLALAGGAFFLARRMWRNVRDTTFERLLFIAASGALLHDVFDFALELNALAPSVVVLVGLLASNERRPDHHRLAARRQGLVLTTALSAFAALALWRGLPTHHQAEKELAQLISQHASADRVRAFAKRAVVRHPADWVLYANTSAMLSTVQPAEALAWLNRLLFLRSADARAHVWAAQSLLRLNKPQQALDEYALAWHYGDVSSLQAGLAVASQLDTFERALVDRPGHLTAAWSTLAAQGKKAEALALLDAAALFAPSDSVLREARRTRVQHEAQLGDPSKALELLDALPRDEQSVVELQMLRSTLLLATGQGDQAVQLLSRLSGQNPSNVEVGLALSSQYERLGRPLAALEVIDRIKPFTSGVARARLFTRESSLWAAQARWGHAIEALSSASRLQPERADLHYELAHLYEKMGSLHSALDEVRKGRTLDTPEGVKAHDAWVDQLERSGRQ